MQSIELSDEQIERIRRNPLPLNDEIQWEIARLAACFGIRRWHEIVPETLLDRGRFIGDWCGCKLDVLFASNKLWRWEVTEKGSIIDIAFFGIDFDYGFFNDLRSTCKNPHPDLLKRTAEMYFRYCGDIGPLEDKFGHLLSLHKQLELRLSLPREFWPEKWIEEEGAT